MWNLIYHRARLVSSLAASIFIISSHKSIVNHILLTNPSTLLLPLALLEKNFPFFITSSPTPLPPLIQPSLLFFFRILFIHLSFFLLLKPLSMSPLPISYRPRFLSAPSNRSLFLMSPSPPCSLFLNVFFSLTLLPPPSFLYSLPLPLLAQPPPL